MNKRMVLILLFHLFCISLVALPDSLQGPVAATVWDVPLRVVDVAAVGMIFAGSVFLYYSIFRLINPTFDFKRLFSENKNDDQDKGV